jgi:hypothetical protein
MFTTKDTGEKSDYCPDNNSMANNARYFQAFKKPSVIKAYSTTGEKSNYPDNSSTTNNARYFQTFKKPSVIKASTTEGHLWRTIE